MALLNGNQPKFFIAGVVLVIIAAILYFKSEALAGWANVEKGKTLETLAIVVFVAGLLSLGGMFVFKGGVKK